MNPLFGAALDVEGFCVRQGWEFCFIGALAVIRCTPRREPETDERVRRFPRRRA